MKPTVKAGVVLGLLVVFWTFFMGFTGWYKNPRLLNLFFLVILIQIAVLYWGLRMVSAREAGFGGLVVSGTLMSLIGGLFAFFGSLLFTVVVFPDYFEELRGAYTEMMRAQGTPQEQIDAALQQMAAGQTPLFQAASGFIGTLVTGAVVSLVLAALLRKKRPA